MTHKALIMRTKHISSLCSTLNRFLKDHVTLKTGIMTLKIQLCHQIVIIFHSVYAFLIK